MASPTFHIAILDADVPVPTVQSKLGMYSDIFTSLLQDASKRLSNSSSKQYPTIQTHAFNVITGNYPSTSLLASLDGIIITGSAASSYYTDPWVQQLDAWIASTYANYPGIKIFGSCFGHQIVCQSLLKQYGARVEKDGKGWEVGVHEIMLSPEFMRAFPGMGGKNLIGALRNDRREGAKQLPTSEATPATSPTPSLSEGSDASGPVADPSSLRLQFVHADHVVIESNSTPNSFPEDWLLLGSTPHCACQGVYEPSRILTFQGHFEFDRFVNSETVNVFGKLAGWDDERLGRALDAIDADDDSVTAAEMVVDFFVSG
jgi:GMP synthase-like glutamine amidotransferase